MAWYVYGITFNQPTVALSGLPGIHGAEIEIQGDGDLCVVASAVAPDGPGLQDDDVKQTLEAIRRHDEVLLVLSRTHSVLPVRFGTVLPDRQAIADLLKSRDGQFRRALAAVAGADEWVIQVDVEPIVDVPHAPGMEELSPGHAFFANRRGKAKARTAARARAASRAAELHEQLSGLARRFYPLPAREPDTLSRAAYLVDRQDAELFVATAESTSVVRIGVQGPLPPYRFVDDESP